MINILKTVYRSVLVVIGHIKWSWYPFWLQFNAKGYKVRGLEVETVVKSMQLGDILLRGYDQYPSSRLIGYWSHTGIVVSSNSVIHAIGKGVCEEHIIDFCRCDRIAVLRPRISEIATLSVVSTAKSYIGSNYDFYFLFNDPRELSCTELLYKCFEPYAEQLNMYPKSMAVFGRVVKPEDVLGYNVNIIHMSK